jgi:hypothetical protein
MTTPTKKLKVTVDSDSADVNRVLTALGGAESNPDTVAVTGQDVPMRVNSVYQPITLPLSPHAGRWGRRSRFSSRCATRCVETSA